MPFTHGGGSGTRKGKRKPPPPSKHERAEHAGRVSQPGVPKGPRQTVPQTPAQKKKHSKERRQRKEAAAATRRAKRLYPKGQPKATAKKPRYDPYAYKPKDALEEEIDRKVTQPLEKAGYHKTTGQKAYQLLAENAPYFVPELGPALRGLTKGAEAVRAGETASRAASVVEGAAEKGIRATAKRAGTKVKTAPAKAARKAKGGVKARATAKAERIKSAPKRIKTAPKRAKKAASTRQGRKAAAKGGLRRAKRHPVRTGYGTAAVSPIPLPGELDKRARAFAKGTAAATFQHPGKTLETTAHGALGFLTAPLALGGAAVQSAKEGSTAPLSSEAKTLAEGTIKMGKALASGDPKLVERTTLQESGLVPFIPVPHLLRRAKRSKAYEGTRGTVRGKVEGKRARTREKRLEEQRAATEKGDFVPPRKARKARQSVADTARPGEKYVLRRTGKLIEKQRSRHYVSREVTRMEEEGAISGKKSSEAVAKIMRKSKGTNQKAQNDADALRIFVNNGLPLEEKAARAYVQMLHDNWPEIKHGDIPPGVHLDRHSTKYIIDHPEIFQGKRGKQFFKAIEEFEKQAKPVGTSPRNRYLAQVNNVVNPLLAKQGKSKILKPEEMVPETTTDILRKEVPKRTDEWNRVEALNYARDLAEVKGPSRAKALTIRKELLDSMEGLMKPPEHGGAAGGVSTTKAVAWTPEMERAFVRRAKEEGSALGLRDPAAYVADVVPSAIQGAEKMSPRAAELRVRKVWPSQGKASMSGNAESSFESLVYHSLEAPRARAATVRGLERIFNKASRPVDGKRALTHGQIEKALSTGKVPDGTLFIRTGQLKALLEGDHVANPEEFLAALKSEVEHGQKLSSTDQLATELAATKGIKGEKFTPVDSVAINELLGHMTPLRGATVGMGHVSNFITRSILNSPAFEASQFAQEGIPMAMALGRNIVNVPKAINAVRQINKLDPVTQAQIRSVVGSSVGVLGAPSLKALRSEGFMDPIRAAGRKPVWREAWDVVNGNVIGRFDRARAGRFREVAAIAKIEGDFRRAEKGFRLWRDSAQNLFKHQREAVEAMKGMTASERAVYVAQHPKLGDDLMKDMTGMAGNWNSFTVFEKHIAPFAIFYPFQRYSALWVLYHFPMDHPVVATALATLGEVNAQELQKLAAKEGSAPNPLDYTKPVINGNVLPAGQRFFAGLAAPQQALLEKKPAQALGSLSPALAIPIEALTGKNAYTGQPLGENGWLYTLRQAASLSPFLRFMGVPEIGQSKSAASEAFHAVDPLRTQRSLFNPYIGQSGKQFGEEKKLERKFSEKYGEGKIPGPFDSAMVQDLLYGGPNGTPQPKKLPEVLRKIHAAERASDFIGKKEKPFLPPDKPFSELQKKLLEEVENAWQTGPGAKKEKKGGNLYLEALEDESSPEGNVYLEALEGSKSKGNPYLEALK